MSKAGKSSRGRSKKTSPRECSRRKTAGKRLQLPEILDLTAAAPLAKSILSRRGAELTVDASRVNRVGAQCLQVLLAAAATWKSDGRSLRLVKPTAEFLECGRLLGIHLDQDLAARECA